MSPHQNVQPPSPLPKLAASARVTTTHNHLTRFCRSSYPTRRSQKGFASGIKILDSWHIENRDIKFLRSIDKPRSMNQNRPIHVVGNKATLCRSPLRELCQPPPHVRCGDKKTAADCFPEQCRPTRKFCSSRAVRLVRNRMQRDTVATNQLHKQRPVLSFFHFRRPAHARN